jgi:hypothetical protein
MYQMADDGPVTSMILNIAAINTAWWLLAQMQVQSYQMMLAYPDFIKTMHGEYHGH